MNTFKLNRKHLSSIGLVVNADDNIKNRISSTMMSVAILSSIIFIGILPAINFIRICDDIEIIAYVTVQLLFYIYGFGAYASLASKKAKIVEIFQVAHNIRHKCGFYSTPRHQT